MNRKLYKGGLTAGVLPLRAIYTPFLISPFAPDVERKKIQKYVMTTDLFWIFKTWLKPICIYNKVDFDNGGWSNSISFFTVFV